MKAWTKALFFTLFFLTGACSVETQKGRESFDNSHLPSQLEKLANQTLELRPLKEEILARVEQDQKIFTLPVAVIDNGVDLAHPDLVGKYLFRVDHGEIVGVGHDFMGDDEFASSVLINPEVFAFSADSIQNGLIVVGSKNPFEQMLEWDRKISAAFLAKLQADPVLSKSVFSKLSLQSFNVFGLYRIVNDEKPHTIFDPSVYSDTMTEGKSLTVDFRDKARTNSILAKAWPLMNVYYFLDYPVHQLDIESGLASMFSFLNTIEHSDLLVQKVKETFNEVPEAKALKDGIDKLVEFRVQRDHAPAPDRVAATDSAAKFLSKALEYQKQGVTGKDPILNLRWTTMNVELSGLDLLRNPLEFPTLTVTKDFVEHNLKASEDRLQEYRNLLNNLPLSSQEKFKMRSFDRDALKVKAMADAYATEHAQDLPLIFDANYHSQYTSMLRKYFFRNKHPYLSTLSEEEVHGTHVSGIIAKQNEALRIYPVRVTTRSALLTKTEYARMVQKYKDEFKAWLQTPIVSKAVFTKFSKMLAAGTTEPTTDAERLAFATAMMDSMNEAIDMAFESDSMDFIFFNELKQALKHVGEQKIKVANISLGAEQKNAIPSLADLNPEKDLPKVFDFLNFEFLKFQIGEILSTVSKGTLFVVAAGNSSTWVDGKAHSALPVDVTSRFLAPFENGKDLQAPNNHLSNVLGVGSLSPDEDLSDFTNVILGIKTPMIFAVGEQVLSPIKTTDLSPVVNLISQKVPQLLGEMPVSPADARFLKLVKDTSTNQQVKEGEDMDAKISSYYFACLLNLDRIISVYATQLAFQYSDHREYLSGTSMATPAVVGTIGDQIVLRAKALGLTPDQVYDHPEMTPAMLIQNLMSTGQPLFSESPEYPFKKIDVRGKYDRGDKVQKLELKLQGILKAAG